MGKSGPVFAALVIAAAAAAQQGPGGAAAQRPVATQPATARNNSVPRIAAAELSERSQYVSVAGRLKPQSRITHQATAAGYVRQIAVREGQAVVVGQPLFTIERNEVGSTFKPVVVESRVRGVVSEVLVALTKEVRTGDAAVVVVATDSYSLEARISDKDAFKVAVGQQVVGRSPDGARFTGVLVSRSQEPDYQTGLFSLTFDFPRAPGASIGTLLILELPTDTKRGVFVNRDIVVRRYGKFFVWIVKADNTLEAREVRVGPVYGTQIQIEGGLAPGERYLTRINGREKNGMSLGGEAP
jgi:multidrug efflux pump subunit AcrA (membrane-fusion protein)